MDAADFTPLASLPELDESLRALLEQHGITTCEQLYALLAGSGKDHPAFRDLEPQALEELRSACRARIGPKAIDGIESEGGKRWTDRRPPGVEPPPSGEVSS